MTWILGSFLVTPCALISCHVVMCRMAVRHGRPVEQVCNQNETTCYQPVRIEGRARDTRPISGVWSFLTIRRLARGCKRWHPLTTGRRYRARRSPLSESFSIYLSNLQQTLCPFRNKMRERYFHTKCFVSLIEVRSLSLIMFLVESIKDYTTSVLRWHHLHIKWQTSEISNLVHILR